MRVGERFIIGALVLMLAGWGSLAHAESAPSIRAISPSEAAPGAEVSIRGSGFGRDRRGVRVTLGGHTVPVRSVNPSEIRFTVPPNASSGNVIVTIGSRTVRSSTPLQVIAPLRIISFSPSQGGPNTEVTIRGSGFQLPPNQNRVTLTGVECTVVGGSATELRIRIPERGVRTGTFEVVTNRGSRARSTGAFTVSGAPAPAPSPTGQGRPVIERLEPMSGPPGTVVRIYGRNFDRRVSVWFSGVRLPVIEFQPTRLTVEIPANARTGRFTLRGRFTVESRQRFRVEELANPPVIASISPNEGPPGTRVEIRGERFGAQSFQNRVTLSGRPCIVRAASSTRLVVEVPVGASSGQFNVQVTDAGDATSSESFTVFASLAINSLSPNNGPPGTELTIRGSGFVADPRQNRVTINGRPARVTAATETELVVEVPRGATSGPVEVHARGNRRRARDPFRITNPPVVQRFAPTSGAPGTEVTIYGSNFGDSNRGFRVRIGDSVCRVISVVPTQARIAIPEGASSGPFEVSVHTQGSDTSSSSFSVYAAVAIREFTPARGPVGTEITIRGSGFSPTTRNNMVRIGGRPARVVGAGETELRVAVPRGVSGGNIRVQVRNRGSAESQREFVVTHAPVVRRFTPSSGAPGTQVVLQGDHFGASMDDVRVTLNGTPCEVTSVRSISIQLRIPSAASSGNFQVTVEGQGSGESNAEFTVDAPLSIAGFSPSGGDSGTEVTITGAGFAPRTRDNRVFIGDVSIPVLSASEEQIRVRIPNNATTGRFRVQARGRGEALSRSSFRVQVALSLERLEPSSGQPGEEVRLIGRGLSQNGLRVLLAGRPLRHQNVSDAEIRVTIPQGARTGPFIVRVPRVGEARSRTVFTVTDPPVLTGMSPVAGPPGTVVTLEGRNFNPLIPRNTATIGNVRLPVEAVSPTQMRVRIPAGASSGTIRVEVTGRGHADTSRPFRVTAPARSAAPPPPPTPPRGGTGAPPPPPSGPTAAVVIQGFSPRAGPPGTMVQILGDGWGTNASALQVWVGNTQAQIVSVDGRMLTIRIPGNAQSGPIRVMRRGAGGGASAQTPVPFNVRR